jgi:hypothetical protein
MLKIAGVIHLFRTVDTGECGLIDIMRANGASKIEIVALRKACGVGALAKSSSRGKSCELLTPQNLNNNHVST